VKPRTPLMFMPLFNPSSSHATARLHVNDESEQGKARDSIAM
jgi:hypothetical protein